VGLGFNPFRGTNEIKSLANAMIEVIDLGYASTWVNGAPKIARGHQEFLVLESRHLRWQIGPS
jgi:hypothetical protein